MANEVPVWRRRRSVVARGQGLTEAPMLSRVMGIEAKVEAAASDTTCTHCGYHVCAPTCPTQAKTEPSPMIVDDGDGWVYRSGWCDGGWGSCCHHSDLPGIHVYPVEDGYAVDNKTWDQRVSACRRDATSARAPRVPALPEAKALAFKLYGKPAVADDDIPADWYRTYACDGDLVVLYHRHSEAAVWRRASVSGGEWAAAEKWQSHEAVGRHVSTPDMHTAMAAALERVGYREPEEAARRA